MAVTVERLTADEYLARDDPRRTELIDGLIVVNAPSLRHQRVCARIFAALDAWARSSGHGEATWPLDLRLEDDGVLSPDVLWFADPLPPDAPRAPRPPELAVEVRSESTWRFDIGRKRQLYERHGVSELWLVDTASCSIITCSRSRPDTGFDTTSEVSGTLRSALLPGFALDVQQALRASAH